MRRLVTSLIACSSWFSIGRFRQLYKETSQLQEIGVIIGEHGYQATEEEFKNMAKIKKGQSR